MTIIINEDTARELLPQAVALRGADYVYDIETTVSCDYERGGEPSCIVGTVLSLAGVDNEVLRELDGEQEARRNGPGVSEGDIIGDTSIDSLYKYGVLEAFGIEVTPVALSALATAQHNQDHGVPWGEAALVGLEILEKEANK